MTLQQWRATPVSRRIHLLRWLLPAVIAVVVLVYQLIFAAYAHDNFGHTEHTLLELLFYAGLGPAVSWAVLTQIGRWLNEKEEAERAVRAGEQQLAVIIDASTDAILSVDAQGVIRSWNRGASSLFSYTADEQIGCQLAALLPDATEPTEDRTTASVEENLTTRHYETVVQTKEGRRLPVDVSQTALVDGQGRPQGASVIVRDISERKAREAVLAEERVRIARDLHDGLAQNLYFVGLKLDLIRKQVRSAPDVAVQEAAALKETVQANINDVRRTIFALRPVNLEGLGFATAIQKYVSEFAEQTRLEIDVRVEGEMEQIAPVLQPQIFRLIQEGLNNIAKHAQARQAQIHLTVTADRQAHLSITDDGVGFDAAALATSTDGRMGVRQMRERVRRLNGHFSLQSSPGQGTLLEATIPL